MLVFACRRQETHEERGEEWQLWSPEALKPEVNRSEGEIFLGGGHGDAKSHMRVHDQISRRIV